MNVVPGKLKAAGIVPLRLESVNREYSRFFGRRFQNLVDSGQDDVVSRPSGSRKNGLDTRFLAGMLFPVMPVTYQIDLSRGLIHTRCIGDVTPEEITEHFRELERDPGRPERLNVLLDLTEETSLPETRDLREVKYQLNKLLRSVRFGACAIVACDEALFGMMRMFGVLTAEYFDMTEVFRAIADAEAWLASVAT